MKWIQRFAAFVREIREEMQHVSWPTREELIGSALVVFVGVTIMATYISACDFLLSKFARFFLR
ncbi:MAG: preprotein translocase subunit SecE [Candidatus Omnitrophica bacterium]|nr:preprotein translocase subunit SecE [Candidatus Omnitrophota bacterium]